MREGSWRVPIQKILETDLHRSKRLGALQSDVYVDAELNEELTGWMRERLMGAADYDHG